MRENCITSVIYGLVDIKQGAGGGGGGEGRRWGVGWFQEGFIGFIVIIILVGELNPELVNYSIFSSKV